MGDDIWEHYAKDMMFESHREPHYVTQQYIKHLEAERDRWQKLAKRLFGTHGHWAGDETWCPAYMCETSECDCGYGQLKADYEQAVRGE